MTSVRTTKKRNAKISEKQNDKQVQVAALCYRETGENSKDVLLITSRETKRWIIPKGWPIDGLGNAEAALQEAWEEAGVKKASVRKRPMGHFDYPKRLPDGETTEIEAEVYLARVERLSENYPEDDERRRKWVSTGEASNLVREPGLKKLLRKL